jgi:hypothetical protein
MLMGLLCGGGCVQVEQGKLVQRINQLRAVREVAFNAANTAIFDVSGQITGGVEQASP